ncbi:MAG TPA: YIP1 family protein [Halanaerobiales bacterium]|nr:YIP1 family protein [Halanaerobiales bacterium]
MTAISNTLDIFYRPGRVFIRNKEKGDWVLPLLIILIISILSTCLLVPALLIPDHIDKLLSNPNLSQEEKEASLGYFQSSFHHFSTFLSTFFFKVVYYPFLALILTLLPLVFGGKPVKYTAVLSAVAYTGIVNSLGFLLDTILKLQHNSLDIGLNLSLVLNSSNLYISSLLKSVNIFGLWQVFLLSLLIYIFYNYSKLKSFLIIFNSYLIIKIISGYFNYLKLIID